ncbi:transposase [Bradyrhizobium shewense]|uniref:transposase n=1 Tax=Bradyrhizobium shewense TaxID=1761772 RepID=UPI001FDAB318|nr:transposase [Bradyrhizobium shewense]
MRKSLRGERLWDGIGRKKRTSIWTARQLGQSAGLKCLKGPSGRHARSEVERARIVAESLLPGAQVAEVARKRGATRWQIYDWRRRFRQRREFAPLVLEGPFEERQVPAVTLDIAIRDVGVRTDAAIDGEQLSRVIRAVRASR